MKSMALLLSQAAHEMRPLSRDKVIRKEHPN